MLIQENKLTVLDGKKTIVIQRTDNNASKTTNSSSINNHRLNLPKDLIISSRLTVVDGIIGLNSIIAKKILNDILIWLNMIVRFS